MVLCALGLVPGIVFLEEERPSSRVHGLPPLSDYFICSFIPLTGMYQVSTSAFLGAKGEFSSEEDAPMEPTGNHGG